MRIFLTKSSNVERESFIWNMAGSLLAAFQSVVFLMILTRTVGLVASGVFTIAYANANLFLNIGKYGMRNFQVSDVKKEFSFQDYLKSRWITTAIMLIVSVIYVLYTGSVNQYSSEKSWIIIWMCLFKLPDAFEDVYYGDYQKKGRLDVASKALTVRMLATIVFFAIAVIFTRNLLTTLILSTIFTTILMVLFLRWTRTEFLENEKANGKSIKQLFWVCFPVFLSAFLSFYIGNAPKYAIDAQLNDELQACYGFIAMPVFVIGLLNGFIFNPILFRLSCLWNDGKVQEFLKNIAKQILIVFSITGICLIGAYLLGIPVLSLLYNTDLSPYKAELLILLLGGGFLGLSGVLCAVITIIRYQNALVVGYSIVALMALVLSNEVVRKYEMMGAAVLYAVLMALLCVCFFFILYVGVKRREKDDRNC